MTFEELISQDHFSAFVPFMTVSKAKEEGIIPEAYQNIFSDKCVPSCGSDRIVRRNLTQVRCCNPRCPVKLSFYLTKIVEKSGVAGVGIKTCQKVIMDNYRVGIMDSHIKLISNPAVINTQSLNNNEEYLFRQAIDTFRDKKLTYGEMISSLAIPTLDSKSLGAFGDITNSEHLGKAMEVSGGFASFMARKGIHDSMVLYYFSEFVRDVMEYEGSLERRNVVPAKLNIKIVTTGPLEYKGISVKTANFIEACNEIGYIPSGDRLFSIQDCDAIESVSYVVCKDESRTSKALRAMQRESDTGKKIRFTCDDFIDLLMTVRNNYLGGVSNSESGKSTDEDRSTSGSTEHEGRGTEEGIE